MKSRYCEWVLYRDMAWLRGVCAGVMKRVLFVAGLFLCGLSLLQADVEQLDLTTYYPAPFGDFENLRANTVHVYNSIGGLPPAITNPRRVEDFVPVRIYQGIDILNQLAAPYGATPVETLDPYIYLKDNRLFFAANGGVFGGDAQSGFLFDEATDLAVVRSVGDVYLQPRYVGATDNFSFLPADGVGTVFIKGYLNVSKGLSVGTSQTAVFDPDGSGNVVGGTTIFTGQTGVEGNAFFVFDSNAAVDSVLAVRPDNDTVLVNGDLIVNGRLIVNGSVEVNGPLTVNDTITATELVVDRMTVRDSFRVEQDLFVNGRLHASDFVSNLNSSDSRGTAAFRFRTIGGGTVVTFSRPNDYGEYAIRVPGQIDQRYYRSGFLP